MVDLNPQEGARCFSPRTSWAAGGEASLPMGVCLRRPGFSYARETGERARRGSAPAPPVPRALKRRGQRRGGEEAGGMCASAPLMILQAIPVCFSGRLSADRQCFPSLLPRFQNRSLCFGLERRSNRTHASIRGYYGNRGCAAREICDDDASGGPVSLAREKPGKERGGALPLHPRCPGR